MRVIKGGKTNTTVPHIEDDEDDLTSLRSLPHGMLIPSTTTVMPTDTIAANDAQDTPQQDHLNNISAPPAPKRSLFKSLREGFTIGAVVAISAKMAATTMLSSTGVGFAGAIVGMGYTFLKAGYDATDKTKSLNENLANIKAAIFNAQTLKRAVLTGAFAAVGVGVVQNFGDIANFVIGASHADTLQGVSNNILVNDFGAPVAPKITELTIDESLISDAELLSGETPQDTDVAVEPRIVIVEEQPPVPEVIVDADAPIKPEVTIEEVAVEPEAEPVQAQQDHPTHTISEPVKTGDGSNLLTNNFDSDGNQKPVVLNSEIEVLIPDQGTHIIGAGQTLSSIAVDYFKVDANDLEGITEKVAWIAERNCIAPNEIGSVLPGQEIVIPSAEAAAQYDFDKTAYTANMLESGKDFWDGNTCAVQIPEPVAPETPAPEPEKYLHEIIIESGVFNLNSDFYTANAFPDAPPPAPEPEPEYANERIAKAWHNTTDAIGRFFTEPVYDTPAANDTVTQPLRDGFGEIVSGGVDPQINTGTEMPIDNSVAPTEITVVSIDAGQTLSEAAMAHYGIEDLSTAENRAALEHALAIIYDADANNFSDLWQLNGVRAGQEFVFPAFETETKIEFSLAELAKDTNDGTGPNLMATGYQAPKMAM